jgi:hypothetical protein
VSVSYSKINSSIREAEVGYSMAQPDYVAERSFEIVEFGYTLNHQKEIK